MRVLSHGRTTNTSQSHGSRQIPAEGSLRLPDHTDNVRPKNSTITPSHATSKQQLWRTGSEIRDPQIRTDGRSSKQRSTRDTVPSKKPCIRTIPHPADGVATPPAGRSSLSVT